MAPLKAVECAPIRDFCVFLIILVVVLAVIVHSYYTSVHKEIRQRCLLSESYMEQDIITTGYFWLDMVHPFAGMDRNRLNYCFPRRGDMMLKDVKTQKQRNKYGLERPSLIYSN